MKLGSVVVLGGIAMVLAWGAVDRNQRAAAARESAVSTYHLDQQQAKVYDACLDALAQKSLKKGGNKNSFCGCFASAAANDDDGLKYSADILKHVADRDMTYLTQEMRTRMASHETTYFSTFVKTTTAALDCVKDEQYIFASNDERLSWCRAKPERAADDRCRQSPL